MRFARSVEAILLERREEQLSTRGASIGTSREREIGQARGIVASAEVRRRIKKERQERIAEFRRQGEPARVIARRLGLSVRQVHNIESAFPVKP